MKINLGELLLALSHALDFMELDLLGGVTNHSKRVAYIALRLAGKCGLSPEAAFDVLSLSILHDNGIGTAFQQKQPGSDAIAPMAGASEMRTLDVGPGHCLAGEENIRDYPFLTSPAGVLSFHHENWDGSGFFARAGNDIPLMAQLIRLADLIELTHHLDGIDYAGKKTLESWLKERSGIQFSPDLVDAFREISKTPAFWLDLKDSYIHESLSIRVPHFELEMSYAELRKITSIFSRIIDSKSRFTRLHSRSLSAKAAVMAGFYGYDEETTAKLRIAADLHDLGKLAVSNAILEKPGKLDGAEIDVIQRHTYFTRVSLQSISGFGEITEWAANHHEKIDGTGYPYRKSLPDLDFNSRLLACLDIYQALTEVRPYRDALSHERAMTILGEMVEAGRLDRRVVADIDGLRTALEVS